ncbi:peroxiredoxin family protein [Carboxylicivirga marina]|uniref:TlpA family protein disulfide reductase n=1 Tax=Carboxylicivirga marina TaxID=2800988 RepID=A0ABS1HFR5_9BACT|nr:TlpA disulfide reductase family protein [Carboxylicivirga marina]MBK3516520.1 TlpA family protein disulfide reductase [Carboxylicivirga marina]
MKNIRYIIAIAVLTCLVQLSFAQKLSVGDTVPEFTQQSVNGESFSLSSLRGQLVLVDFWASWCAPCRKENPHLVEAYQQYKNVRFNKAKGFTILSVSLDMKDDAWKKAIKDDGLVWPHHTSDLKGWRNAVAKQYGVRKVPSNFLIDEEGVIVAVDLRGEALLKKLKKLQRRGWYRFWE